MWLVFAKCESYENPGGSQLRGIYENIGERALFFKLPLKYRRLTFLWLMSYVIRVMIGTGFDWLD